MLEWARRRLRAAYRRHLERNISSPPEHVAVIQDGNRRYARERGADAESGHRAGAETTADVLEWCSDLGVQELTLYAFSTENFARPPEEREHLFDLLAEKLREFAEADRVHEQSVAIRAIGATDRLPPRVRDAIEYAEHETRDYDEFTLNVAVAYGGRAQLLAAARSAARDVTRGDLDPDDIDVAEIQSRLHDDRVRDVDLIVRTGGDERTSNFLPWHANGNEAAVFFCAPYWPEFSKVDFLRGIRTYESREASWRQARVQRALALVRAVGGVELDEARAVLNRFRHRVPDDVPDPAEDVAEHLDERPAD